MPKDSLKVNTPGRIEKGRSLTDTRHLSSFHVCQACRVGVMTLSELTSSTSNAGELEVAIYPGRESPERLHTRGGPRQGLLQGEPDRLYHMTNTYVDSSLYHVQCPPFTLYNMVSNLELYCCTSKNNDALLPRHSAYPAWANCDIFCCCKNYFACKPEVSQFVQTTWFQSPVVTLFVESPSQMTMYLTELGRISRR